MQHPLHAVEHNNCSAGWCAPQAGGGLAACAGVLDISLSVLSAACLLPPNDSLVLACLSIACILHRLQAPELPAQTAVYSNMSATAHCSSLCELCACDLLLPALVFAHILSCRHHGACVISVA